MQVIQNLKIFVFNMCAKIWLNVDSENISFELLRVLIASTDAAALLTATIANFQLFLENRHTPVPLTSRSVILLHLHFPVCWRQTQLNTLAFSILGSSKSTFSWIPCPEMCVSMIKKIIIIWTPKLLSILLSYLIGPDALDPRKPSDTTAHLHILMGGVHLL